METTELLRDLSSIQSAAELLRNVDTDSELSLNDVANTGLAISNLAISAIERVRLINGGNDVR